MLRRSPFVQGWPGPADASAAGVRTLTLVCFDLPQQNPAPLDEIDPIKKRDGPATDEHQRGNDDVQPALPSEVLQQTEAQEAVQARRARRRHHHNVPNGGSVL
jgi:hypothetical protein